MIPGGGTIEMTIARELRNRGAIYDALANSFEEIPFLLAKNAGLDALDIVGQLRTIKGGVNVRLGCVTEMIDEEVVQPVKVMKSGVDLAIETAQLVLMIDDILPTTN